MVTLLRSPMKRDTRQFGLDVRPVTRQTPWMSAVTQQPERFGFSGRGRTLLVSSGRDICRLNVDTNEIVQIVGSTGEARVQPYRLSLQRWTRIEPPFVDAHPFFLLHLFVTGQVDTEELMARALSRSGGGTTRATLSMQKPSELHRMLGRSQFALRLMTSFNLSTTQG